MRWSTSGAGCRWRRTRSVAAAFAPCGSGCGRRYEEGGHGMNATSWRAGEWRWARALWRWVWRLRRPLMLREMGRLRVATVSGTRIIFLPGVFDGVRLRTGAFFAQTLTRDTCPPGARVLDVGTGSGLLAIFAARYAEQVIATDINPEAVRCAQVNLLAH